MKRSLSIWLSIFVLMAILLSACGSAATPTTEPVVEETEEMVEPTQAPEPTVEPTKAPEQAEVPVVDSMIELDEVDPAAVTGDLTSAGSSTVFPLAEAIQTLFESEGYTGVHTIASVGTGGGFERFCKTGETDIANASRAIKDSEVESCTAINRTPIGFQIGIDALAVVVSSANDFLTDVTKAELAKIFSKDAILWSDVRPEWPQETILRFSPGTDSGTFDYFVEAVMDPAYVVDKEADAGKGEAALLEAQNLQLSEDDNVLVQGVEGSPYAIGYFGYAYFNENQGNLTAVSVDSVAPTAETAEDGSYPLSRPLFIYSDAAIMQSKPQVASYVSFFLSRVGEVIADVGYFPVSGTTLDASKQAYLDALSATVELSAPMIILPEVDPATVAGDLTSAGSSTVFPLAEAIQTLFESEGYTGVHTIASVGTGGGFERFCKTGETDIANASRAIKDSEVESCTAINRTPIGFQIGIDALAVVVSSANDFLTDVTKAELAKIFSKDAILWSDVRPEWPQETILRFSPGTDSGTFDYFVEAVMDPAYVVDKEADAGKGEAALLEAQNLQLSEDDNVLVQGVEGSPYAIGYFGYAYFNENQGNLTAVSVDSVAPTAETAEDGSYPLSRPLFIYSDAAIMQSKPQVASYVSFFLSRVGEIITDVGYFPVSDATLNVAKQAWLDAMK